MARGSFHSSVARCIMDEGMYGAVTNSRRLSEAAVRILPHTDSLTLLKDRPVELFQRLQLLLIYQLELREKRDEFLFGRTCSISPGQRIAGNDGNWCSSGLYER